MRRVFYAIGVALSAFFLVSAGVSENEAIRLIPDYEKKEARAMRFQ